MYAKAPVTQVEEQPFTIDGVEGLYRGDRKGDRPEGHGDFIIGDFENSSAGRYLQRSKEEAANYLAENNVRDALREKAKEEARLEHYDEAEKLLDEAEKHHISI